MPPSQELAIKDKIKIRPMTEGDFNFVISSWLKSYKYSGTAVRRMIDRVYYDAYEPIVKSLIKRSDVYIACLRSDPDAIVGYLAIERVEDHDIIHYCNIRDIWQKMGIASYLIEAAQPQNMTYFTHWTSPIQSLIHKIPYVYQPFLIKD